MVSMESVEEQTRSAPELAMRGATEVKDNNNSDEPAFWNRMIKYLKYNIDIINYVTVHFLHSSVASI